MDLFLVLRISLYAVVGAGAFSISLAEQRFTYLLTVAAFAAISFLTMDKGRVKPVREHYFGAMTLALWLYHFPFAMPDGADWNRVFLTALSHFLCSFQVLLFFRHYRDWILLVCGVSTLATVIISGVLNHDATLLIRIAVFVAVTAWTLFIHSMWRAREAFAMRRLAAARGNASAALPPDAPRIMPERAFWQGLSMMAYLSITCLALGLFLFFSTPRLERFSAVLEAFMPRRDSNNKGGGRASQVRGASRSTGFSERVNINDMGPIGENNALALTVTFSPSVGSAVDSRGRIFLRSMAMSHHENGLWLATKFTRTLQADPEKNVIPIVDPTAPKLKYFGTELKQVVDASDTPSNVFFAVAPVSRVVAAKVEIDEEGVLRLPNDVNVNKYEIWSYPPVHQGDLDPNAIAEHFDRGRYITDHGLRADVVEDVRRKALQITTNETTPLGKVRAIARHLRESGEYGYTLKLNELKRKGDPIAEFLLSADPNQRRGHCGYFASAFVVLCRLNAIPARMASGFATTIAEQTDAQGKRITFKNSDAHAWGEVFFKDYGWVVFEATPASNGQETVPENKPVALLNGTQPEQGAISSFMNILLGYNSEEQGEIIKKFNDAVKSTVGGAGAVMTGQSVGGWIFAGIAWLAVGFAIVWLVQIFLRRSRRRTLRGSVGGGRTQAALSFYNDLLQVLQRRGFVRKPGQTPREFAEHVVRQGGESFKSVLLVTQVFESVRYGGEDISQEDFNLLQNSLDHLRELTFASAVPSAKS